MNDSHPFFSICLGSQEKMAASGSGADRNAPGFKVAVESILQRRIKEITYEGEEIYEEYINNSYLMRSTFMSIPYLYM